MIGMMQRLGVRAPILLIGGILVTLTLDPVLALILIILLPILALVIVMIYKKGFPLFTAQQSAVDNLVRTVRENITGIRVIKALSKTDYEKGVFSAINSEVVQKEKKAGMTMAGLNPIVNLLLNIGLVFVILVGAYRVNAGTSEVGKIIAFLTYFTIMLQSIMAISRLFITFSKSGASAARITQVIDADIDLLLEEIKAVPSNFHIEFNQVCFSYNKSENNISDIDFKIKKGESLGIIGSTGSGKTTLINLLMRFYDVDAGEILIDGKNIKSLDESELRKKFGVVFQNDVLFADSIYQNIDFGRHLGKEKIHTAATDAQAMDFIEGLEEKYDSMLDIRGSNLSGGQKQRLLIARALAANPEILILDDSSSALDYKTDSLLRRALDKNLHSSTKIIIAQRISSIMSLDHIMVLEDGKIAGYGTHDELLNTCDIYKEISKSQMGGE
jgi:ATP-binding cassette subfamily B protein